MTIYPPSLQPMASGMCAKLIGNSNQPQQSPSSVDQSRRRVILHKASVRYIDVICMHSAMLNDDTLLHRYVVDSVRQPVTRSFDDFLVSSTICCTNSTLFLSSSPPHYYPISADASVNSNLQGQRIFTRKGPFDSGTSWSSSSISRVYGITHSSVPRRDRHLYSTSSACVRCYARFNPCFLHWL